MSDLLQELRTRRSVRCFAERPIPDEVIRSTLEAGRLAPSPINLQPTRVLVARESRDLEAIQDAAYGIGACTSAPCILVCMADMTATGHLESRIAELTECGSLEPTDTSALFSRSGRPFELKVDHEVMFMSVAVAVAHMELQAVNLGLGTCWVHHADFDDIRAHFDIPSTMEVVTLLALGYGAESPEPRPRIHTLEWQPK